MENKKRRRGRGRDKKRRRGREREEQYSEELVTDIISRLPAKDLTRFTCVSKSWRSLISTDPYPYFRRLHSTRTASVHRPFLLIGTKNRPNLQSLYDDPYEDPRLLYNYWIDLDSIEGHSNHMREINNPFDRNDGRRRRDAKVIGSCNGLVLKTAVSNPTTKEHVMIPPNPAGDANVVFYGLGYDSVQDCYKVVAKVDHLLELVVYDLNKGTWGRLQFGAWWRRELKGVGYGGWGNMNEDEKLNTYSVECVDGGVYWCIHDKVPKEMAVMVCFLLAEEEFLVVMPPDLGEVKYYPRNTVLDDRFALMSSSIEDDWHEVWSLGMDDDDGTRQWRWTKLFAISDPYAMLPSFHHDPNLIPLCFSECRNKVLIRVVTVQCSQLFWYDLRKKEFHELDSRINELMHWERGWFDNARSCVSGTAGLGFSFRPSQQTNNN